MGEEAPNASMPEAMYTTEGEEMLCILSDSNGLSIELVDSERMTYWINPGVTDWSHNDIMAWVEDLLSGYDYALCRLHEGPVEVEIYDEA